jgi:hypothetical protein
MRCADSSLATCYGVLIYGVPMLGGSDLEMNQYGPKSLCPTSRPGFEVCYQNMCSKSFNGMVGVVLFAMGLLCCTLPLLPCMKTSTSGARAGFYNITAFDNEPQYTAKRREQRHSCTLTNRCSFSTNLTRMHTGQHRDGCIDLECSFVVTEYAYDGS